MASRALLDPSRLIAVTVAASLLLAAPAGATRLFRTDYSVHPGLFPTTGSGYYPAVADVDGDGRDDLLNLRFYTSPARVLLEVRLGAPGGEMSPALATFATGLQADAFTYPATGHLDGDALPDLMISAVDTVCVLPATGGGAFGAPTLIAVPGCQENGIASGDFDEDGIADLVVARMGADAVRILWGMGGMQFTTGPDFNTNPGPEFVCVGDLNGDSHLDIVVGANVASAVLLGDGSGAFTAGTVPLAKVRLLADLDGDGALDAVAPSAVALGLGDGTFAAAVANLVADPWAAADFDEDGLLDLAGLGTNSLKLVRIQRGIGGGAFGPVAEYSNNASCFALASGDLDGDGHADLAGSTFTNSYTTVYHGTGNGTLEQAPYFAAGLVPTSIAAGNLNGDAWPDLVLVGTGSPSLSVLLSTGPATFAPPQLVTQPQGQVLVRTGDLNGDGRDDVLSYASGSPIVRVNLTQPSGLPQFTNTVTLPGSVTRLQVADMNADGKRDLLYSWTSATGIALGDGSGGFGAPIDLGFLVANDIQAADVNGDGWMDIVGMSGLAPRICLASAPGVFASFTDLPPVPSSASVIRVGRLNADASPDLMIQAGGGLHVYAGTGGGAFGPRVALSGTPATLSHWADVNGDGLDDIVSAPVAQSVQVALNDGASGFLPARGFGNQLNYLGTGLADVDGNGRPDLVAMVSSNFLPSTPQRVVLQLNQTVTPNVGVEPRPAAGARLAVRAWPNPSHGVIRLALASAAAAPVRVTLVDVAGRVVESRTFAAGTSELSLGHAGLGAGLYFARVERGGQSAMTRVCVIR